MSSTRIVCLTRALTRLTHMGATAGNEAILAREPVTTATGERRLVPTLSGNALRHVCVRAPGVRWLVDEYGLAGSLSLAQLNFLFHGGSLTEPTGREPTARIVEMHGAIPLLKLLGGALPDQILQGSLDAGPGVLVCEENRGRLEAILGEDAFDGLPPLAPGESFVESYQYSTYDVRGREPDLAERAPDFAESASDPRMLYTGQCVRAGACFAHEWFLLDPTKVDVGALLWSLELWHRAGGFVGGMSAKGHGRTQVLVAVEEYDPAECVRAYLDHARQNRDRAVAWLNAAFAKPQKAKPGRGRKKKAETAEGTESTEGEVDATR
jgi:hypothetical protein